MSKSRALLRLSRLALHVASGLTTAALHHKRHGNEWFDRQRGQQVIRQWADRFCRIVGVEIQSKGQLDDDARLIVANHISWLDVPVLTSRLPLCFVAKEEIRHWPVVGRLAARAGTLFIKRGSRSILGPLLATMEQRLTAETRLAVFPEGTTSDGNSVKRFHPALFEACAGKPHRVQPMAIRYCERDGSHLDAPYINDDHFLPHLWRILQRKQTRVMIELLPAISAETKERRELAIICHMLISSKFPRLEQRAA